ncbi:NAD(P)H-dependent flavin oxidoreductase [Bacillus marasmi]|uniref:NAD(P)H-dependent flavin oxidoreductase n=1 Tax=Bacillus marasmi TaxID=1926279 RepID=UPI0011C796FE|nr:nitronate monooxygenase [Bacillus marasmi]
MLRNEITELLQIDYPIIQAPMAGGVTTPTLVAAVSNNGCLGMFGSGYLNAEQTREQIKEAKKLTSNHFGINLFVPTQFSQSIDEINQANLLLQPFREKLNIATGGTSNLPDYESASETFHEQIRVIIEERVPVCSFTFGIPSSEVIRELKQHNIIVIGTATTVDEAIEVEKCGMDMVVVQGCEAGGHRGNFLHDVKESQIGLMSLIPQVTDNVNIPVIAAGGIMDGRGLRASLCLGAKAVQMGTAFLTCQESGAHKLHKESIVHAGEDQAVLTRAFSGKWARGIKNIFITETQNHEAAFAQYPVQNTLTQNIRKAAAAQGNPEFMSLWSGQSPRLAKSQSVEELISRIVAELLKK